MKERPILFSAPMVRAILSGAKTQTRRVVPTMVTGGRVEYPGKRDSRGYSRVNWLDTAEGMATAAQECKYGQPGDRLWVRETWMPDAPRDGTWAATAFYGCGMSPLTSIPERFRKPEHCLYRATWHGHDIEGWKPSIHMPRWASRITLEVAGVRVERLQDISADDAKAEGISEFIGGWWCEHDDAEQIAGMTPQEGYRHLWERINGPGSWDANPWVWVIDFKKLEQA